MAYLGSKPVNIVDLATAENLTVNNNLNTPSINTSQVGGRRNLIINGAMQVNQRGSAATVNADTQYGKVDRYAGYGISGGQFTLNQSTVAPDGFGYSNIATVTSADTSIASGDYYGFVYRVEGNDIVHLDFGSSSAKTVTLSFWVRSSVTGTFGGAFRNSAANRSFVFSYTINTADTWEYKSVTVPGDTSGTWLTTNGTGIILSWSLGDGSSRLNTAGSWVAGNYAGVTGQTNLIETSSATWQITGVQLEVGTVATEFEHRNFAEELAMCQRYYYRIERTDSTDSANAIGRGVANTYLGIGQVNTSSSAYIDMNLSVHMRDTPTVDYSAIGDIYINDGAGVAATSLSVVGHKMLNGIFLLINVSGGLTAGRACRSFVLAVGDFLELKAEL